MTLDRRRVAVPLLAFGPACASSTPPAPAKPSAAPTAVAVAAPPAPATGAAASPVSPGRETPDAPFRQLAPPAGAEPTFKPPKPKRFKLKNGLEVMLVEFHDLPLVDFNLMIKTGGAANPTDRAGLADLTAHMLDEGTR